VTWPARLRFHGVRAALAVLVGAVAWASFPRVAGDLPPRLEEGTVADADIIAPRGFVVTKTDAARAREAEELASTVKAVVRADPLASDTAQGAAARFFALLDSAAAAGADVAPAARAAGIALDSAETRELERPSVRARLRRAVAAALRGSRSGFLAPGVAVTELGPEVVLRSGGSERVVSADSLPSFSDFLEQAAAQMPAGAPAAQELLYVRVLGAFFQPTLVYERAETERHRDQLRRSVDSVLAVVRAGE